MLITCYCKRVKTPAGGLGKRGRWAAWTGGPARWREALIEYEDTPEAARAALEASLRSRDQDLEIEWRGEGSPKREV